jgi:acyl transferase domain-containing protein/phosphopantetheinyl transferase (holo-ACP synthase)
MPPLDQVAAGKEPTRAGTQDAAVDLRAPIAIIGMACIFPQAPDLHAFWNNILEGVDAIGEPVADWGAQRYLDAGRIKTPFGGYLKDLYRFDPREFGIMPNSVAGGETDQYLALRVARDALADAGYLDPGADHSETGIVLGHSAYLHAGQVTVIQNNIVIDQTMDLVRAAMPHMGEDALRELRAMLLKKLPPTNADNAPGLVPNMMTGRIANRLNLRGPNYVLDAACASSLLAVAAAADELRTGRSRMMLAGGVNATLPADVNASFTQLGALSARGKVRPFEAGSDGTLLGEGLGVVVLKRLDDAIADGDRVYAVLRGVGHSSDGKGTGLLAPSHDGETLAIRRAYAGTGVDPASVDLVEAHGTGIPLGDKTEIASLGSVFGERKAPVGTKALGSVKSMISHCIPAAGIASLIKMSLSLHHRTLPPTLCEQVNPELGIDKTPFYINTAVAPWMVPTGQPRRAAVNSFGFGGINAHAILEQAPETATVPGRMTDWPVELCVLSADSADALVAKLDALAAGLERNSSWRLPEVAAALAKQDASAQHRVAILARDMATLASGIAQAQKKVREGKASTGAGGRSRVFYGDRRVEGKLAFLFPGEGSQYPHMFAELALRFEPVQRWLDFWRGLYGLPAGESRTDIVFPSSEVDAARRAQLEQRLHGMDVGSEAVFIGGMAMHELLKSLGIEPDVMLGHSSGESAALAASGANAASTPQELSDCISKHYAVYDALLQSGKIPVGALLAVGALPSQDVDRYLAQQGRDVQVAMDNCSNQIVLYGSVADIAHVQEGLTALGAICMPLPFDRGYHTPAFAEVSEAFEKYYEGIGLERPNVPLYSCASVDLFPDDPAQVRALAAGQWSQTVRFRETIRRMHDDGVRVFVEVGPSGNLTAFVNDILADRDCVALASNVRRKNGVEQLLSTLAQLYAVGREVDIGKLFSPREIAAIDLAGTAVVRQPPVLDNTMPMVRFSDADRERVRQLAQPPAQTMPQPQAVVQAVPQALATEAATAGTAIAAPVPGSDGRVQVMSEYFEVMRDFLDRQSELMHALPAAEAVAAGEDFAPAHSASTHAVDSATPLLDGIVEHDDAHLVAVSRVALDNDQFVRDHVLSGPVSGDHPNLLGLACVPFMASLELMAEACAALAGRTDLGVIENVKAFDWIALDDGALDIEVRARVIDRERRHYAAEVYTPRGIAVSGEFRFDRDWRLGDVAPLVEPRPWDIHVSSLYTTDRHAMFHGPVFQSVREILAWNDSGIDVRLSEVSLADFFAPGHAPQLILNPVLLDALSQVAPCWLVQYVGPEFHSFPSYIERIELYEPCPADRAGIVVRGRQRPADGTSTDINAPRNWDFDCIDGEGRVLLRCHAMGNLFFRVPATYHMARVNPLQGFLGAPVEPLAADGVSLWQVPMIAPELATQSGGICMRVLAHLLLSAEERGEWRLLQGSVRRHREWLSGRAALKEAVRYWIHLQTGQLVHAADVVVWHDELGAPHVDGWWNGTLVDAPCVSLTHNGETCLAAVSAPGLPVGVDLEVLGRAQPELVAQSLAAHERPLVEGLSGAALDERVLRLWCAKEAAAKCLGTGLQGEPAEFGVHGADAACENMRVEHPLGTLAARVVRRGDAIIAVATPASPEPGVRYA